MAYQKTGRPPGRPRKDGQPVRTQPKPRPPAEKPSEPSPPVVQEPPVEIPAEPVEIPAERVAPAGPFAICPACYPDGWPAGATGLGCQHGIWSRPWTGR